MRVDLHSYSNMGSRELNEDSYGVENDGGRLVAVLCDGLGGHDCGEVASEAAVKLIIDGITGAENLNAEAIHGVIADANNKLMQLQSARPSLKGMRTTAVGCAIEDGKMTYFNCGDSRFYYFSGGTLSCMTKDHSVSQLSVEMGDMSFDSIRFDADRNKLLKVLGQNNSGGDSTVYSPINCKKGDAFLLCSDGFWEYVVEEEMEIDLSKATTAKEWIDFMLVRLLLRFNGNNDNFTVVGGFIK